MKLHLQRLQFDADVTIGALSIDDAFECWTCEDAVRPDGVKIHGETAIPYGTYTVDITMSPRFKRRLPLLINVANFVGIRIHPGNTANDTEGCILVGQARWQKGVGNSRAAFNALMQKLESAKSAGESITIEITK